MKLTYILSIFFYISDESSSLASWGVVFVLLTVVAVVIMKIRKLRRQYAFIRYQERSKHLLTDFDMDYDYESIDVHS